MSDPSADPRKLPRRRAPGFRPRFTLTILYLFGFFVLYSMILVLPELLDVLANIEPGPEQEAAAREATRRALGGKLLPVFVLALATAGAGAYYQILPGMRPSG